MGNLYEHRVSASNYNEVLCKANGLQLAHYPNGVIVDIVKK